MGYKCPKCGYERQPEDLAPEYECPKCGVIYEKVKKVQARKEDTRRDIKSQNKTQNRKLSTIVNDLITEHKIFSVFFCSIIVFYLIVFLITGAKSLQKPDEKIGTTRQELIEYKDKMQKLAGFEQELNSFHRELVARLDDPYFTSEMLADGIEDVLIPGTQDVLYLLGIAYPQSKEIRNLHETLVEATRIRLNWYKKLSTAARQKNLDVLRSSAKYFDRSNRLFQEAIYKYRDLCAEYGISPGIGE